MSHYLSAKVEYRTYSRKFFESFASAKIYLHCARIIKFLKFVISVFTYVRWADNVDDMKRIIVTLVMGFSFLGLFGQTNKFMTVGVNEFEKFIADTTVTLLDVRTPAEHAEGFIPGTHFKKRYSGISNKLFEFVHPYCHEFIGLTKEAQK